MYDEIAMRHLHGGPNDIRGTEWLKRVEEFIKVKKKCYVNFLGP